MIFHNSKKLVQYSAVKSNNKLGAIICAAYYAGELKHGPISLIEQGTLVVTLATVDKPINLAKSVTV